MMEKKTLYLCSPMLNVECKKTHCAFYKILGECNATTKEEYAVKGKDGKPVKVVYFDDLS